MKKILLLLLTIVSIGYSQRQFNAYLFEYGSIDTITRMRDQEIIQDLENIVVELTETDVTIHTKKLQHYFFYQDISMKFEDTYTFKSSTMFIDQDTDVGLLTYVYNKLTDTRVIEIDYNNIYFKYYLR